MSKGLEFRKREDGGYAVVGMGKCRDRDVEVPAVFRGEPVVEIGERAFDGCAMIDTLRLPPSVTRFGYAAFAGCRIHGLYIDDPASWCRSTFADGTANPLSCSRDLFVSGEEVHDLSVPDGVKEIAPMAFSGYLRLFSVTLPEGLERIGEGTFEETSLTRASLPSTLRGIGDGAFRGCMRLVEIRNLSPLPLKPGDGGYGQAALCARRVYSEGASYVYERDGCVFYGDGERTYLLAQTGTGECLALPDIGTPYGIYPFAFCSRRDLVSVEIPPCVTEIGEAAFMCCPNLARVSVAGAEKIGTHAFADCRALRDIELGAGLREICRDAFFDCRALERVILPEGVERVDGTAFSYCPHLRASGFPDGAGYPDAGGKGDGEASS